MPARSSGTACARTSLQAGGTADRSVAACSIHQNQLASVLRPVASQSQKIHARADPAAVGAGAIPAQALAAGAQRPLEDPPDPAALRVVQIEPRGPGMASQD